MLLKISYYLITTRCIFSSHTLNLFSITRIMLPIARITFPIMVIWSLWKQEGNVQEQRVQNKSSFNLFCFCHLRAAWQWVAGTGAPGSFVPKVICSHLLSTCRSPDRPLSPLHCGRVKIITQPPAEQGLELGVYTLTTFVTALTYSWY